MSEMERAVSEWPRGPKEMSSFLRSSSLSSNSYTWAALKQNVEVLMNMYFAPTTGSNVEQELNIVSGCENPFPLCG